MNKTELTVTIVGDKRIMTLFSNEGFIEDMPIHSMEHAEQLLEEWVEGARLQIVDNRGLYKVMSEPKLTDLTM